MHMGLSTLKSWEDAQAAITERDGTTTMVRAESLSNCISVAHSLTLATGQDVPFDRMKAFHVTEADSLDVPNAKASFMITLLDGATISGRVDTAYDLFGYNEWDDLRRHFSR
jgi:hypothetical protein